MNSWTSQQTSLKKVFPFSLQRTNADGVYGIAAPPEHLDVRGASAEVLASHGLFLPPRPSKPRTERAASVWDHIDAKGLRVMTPAVGSPRLRRKASSFPRRVPGTRDSAATGKNYAGCELSTPASGWQSVTAAFQLPYLSVPAGGFGNQNQGSVLAAWVALTGQQFFQTVMLFYLDMTTDPPTPVYEPTWQWWSPDPSDPYAEVLYSTGSGFITNPPPMQAGDVVQLYSAYFDAPGGQGWGNLYFIFFNDLETVSGPSRIPGVPGRYEVPTLYTLFFPAPSGATLQASSVDWMLENASVTDGTPYTTSPVFSGSPNAITPITFTGALAGQGLLTRVLMVGPNGPSDMINFVPSWPVRPTGPIVPEFGPLNGTVWTWQDASGNALTSTTLGGESVSILYAG